MAVIFGGSTDLLAECRTSRIIGPIMRWFDPHISDAAIGRVQFVVRKAAHVTEYAVLALLVWRALIRTKQLPGGSRDDELVRGSRAEEALSSPQRTLSPLTPTAVGALDTPLGVVATWPAARLAALTLLVCTLYALSDEVHQGFVATRHASLWDVLLDCGGAGAGLVLGGLARRWRRKQGGRLSGQTPGHAA
jgi:VanZ family protein